MSEAIETIGNRARTEILHQLSIAGPLTTGELMEALQLARPRVLEHLAVLERAELVTGDVAGEDRHGRTVRWHVLPEQVRAVAARWADYAAPLLQIEAPSDGDTSQGSRMHDTPRRLP